jgi:hypothetical protein
MYSPKEVGLIASRCGAVPIVCCPSDASVASADVDTARGDAAPCFARLLMRGLSSSSESEQSGLSSEKNALDILRHFVDLERALEDCRQKARE